MGEWRYIPDETKQAKRRFKVGDKVLWDGKLVNGIVVMPPNTPTTVILVHESDNSHDYRIEFDSNGKTDWLAVRSDQLSPMPKEKSWYDFIVTRNGNRFLVAEASSSDINIYINEGIDNLCWVATIDANMMPTNQVNAILNILGLPVCPLRIFEKAKTL